MGRRNRKFRIHAQQRAQETVAVLDRIRLERDKEREHAEFDNLIIRDPVTIFHNGKWVTVDRSSRDFPLPVKMEITPDWALEVVSSRNENNRNVRNDRVEKYVCDIVSGNWEVINNGIGFYADGTLADGQHRLWAIWEAKKSVQCIVLFGMSPKAVSKIDEGAARTNKDVANLMGMKVGNAQLSITNYLLEYKGVRRTTPRGEQIAFFERHSEAVEFVVEKLRRKGVAKAPVMAALVRAWYNINKDVLRRFLDILESGVMAGPEDQSAIALREFLIKNNNNSGPFRMEMYRKTEAAIVNFVDKKPVTRLYGMQDEQFPLPEEKVETTTAA